MMAYVRLAHLSVTHITGSKLVMAKEPIRTQVTDQRFGSFGEGFMDAA